MRRSNRTDLPGIAMQISHFNTFPYGGAATAALRTHRELLQQGIQSRYFWHRDDRDARDKAVNQELAAHAECSESTDASLSPSVTLNAESGASSLDEAVQEEAVQDEAVEQIRFKKRPTGFFGNLFGKRKRKDRLKSIHRQYDTHLAGRDPTAETFSMAELPEESWLPDRVNGSDLIHLHWVSWFADYPSFFQSIDRSIPIVWTLHDMNPFTGGCHYASGCERFSSGCGGCPQVIAPGPRDVSASTMQAKQDALKDRRLHVVAPSQWMIDLAKRSPVWPTETTFEKIHLGLELSHFYPVDRAEARRQLELDPDKVIVGFGADDLSSRRKGFHHLVSAMNQLKTGVDVECLVFGKGEIEKGQFPMPIHQAGFVDSPERQRLIYSAMDIVVVPSQEDNQPQVGLEAMACGVPVVAFNAGGIPEYVRDGTTGCIAERGNEAMLAEKISALCDLRTLRQRMGRSAMEMIRCEFELKTQTRRYLDLYQRIAPAHAMKKSA